MFVRLKSNYDIYTYLSKIICVKRKRIQKTEKNETTEGKKYQNFILLNDHLYVRKGSSFSILENIIP